MPNALHHLILNIVHGSLWGVLARVGLEEITHNSPGLRGVVWANFAACIVMGMAVESSHMWSLLSPKASLPLYVGITTGFCGTCSSFSSWMAEAFILAADLDIGHQVLNVSSRKINGGYGFEAYWSTAIAQLSISIAGLAVGKHIMGAIDPKLPRWTPKTYRWAESVSSGIGLACYIVAIVMSAVKFGHSAWRAWMFPIIFAAPGALLRFYASKVLNPVLKSFPLGTFFCNSLGTLLIAVFYLLQYGSDPSIVVAPYVDVLSGMSQGFCGALTTVSTFVVELRGLGIGNAYRYGVVSIGVGTGFMVLILGSWVWTNHGLQ